MEPQAIEVTTSEEKKKTPHPARIPVGIMLVLLGVAGLLNRFFISYLNYLLIYLFGTTYFLLYLCLIVAGIFLIFKKAGSKKSWNISLTGLLILGLTVSVLTSYLLYGQEGVPEPTFANIILIQKQYGMDNIPLSAMRETPLNLGFYGGGIFGNFFHTLFSAPFGRIGSLVIIILLFVLGFIFLFWSFFKLIIKGAKKKLATKRKRDAYFESVASLESDSEDMRTLSSHLREKKATPIAFDDDFDDVPLQTTELEHSYGLKKAVFHDAADKKATTIKPAPIVQEVEFIDSMPATEIVEHTSRVETLEEAPLLKPIHQQEEKIEKPQPTRTVFKEEPSLKIEKSIPDPQPTLKTKIVPEQEIKPRQQPQKYEYPGLDLLSDYSNAHNIAKNIERADERLEIINQTFVNFNIGAKAINYTIGPSVTQFDIQMDLTESVTVINKYIPDLSSRLGGVKARFSPIIENRSTSGLEVPNDEPSIVGFKECLAALPPPNNYKNRLLIPFGKSVDGTVASSRIDEAPHMLVAGASGSGKSIFIHALIMTLIMRNTPDEMRMMIIDPKRLDTSKYRDMPHLLCPLINDASEAKVALDKLVLEMENRYELIDEAGASKISEYNEICESLGQKILPTIIVVIDEYGDLVGAVKDISSPIVRLAQKSRAAGIHLVIATQRPSADIITGVIKGNIPTRVALKVASPTDSVVILGEGGAEDLLGKGDMLVQNSDISSQGTFRLQGSYVDNKEIRAVVRFLKDRYPTKYYPEFLDLKDRSAAGAEFGGFIDQKDERYDEIKSWVLTQDFVSINKIQTGFGMGFSRASKIFNRLKDEEIVEFGGESNSSRGSRVIAYDERSPEEIRIDNNEY